MQTLSIIIYPSIHSSRGSPGVVLRLMVLIDRDMACVFALACGPLVAAGQVEDDAAWALVAALPSGYVRHSY